MSDLPIRKLPAAVPLLAACVATVTTGHSQAGDAVEQPPRVLERFVVTGSNIPMAADAAAVPVAIIGRQVMEDSGVSADTLDILRKVAPNISGVGQENAQTGTGTHYGGASVNIRGLPTLVLLDGRRVANSPAESTGGAQFVDLNLIPPAAIERIEVLQVGASAIYGSDAVGGVVNIILKRNYSGWEVGAHYGTSAASGRYEERSGYLAGGVSSGRTSVTLSLDYSRHNALYLSSRPYTNPIYGTYTAPGTLENYDNLTGADDFYRLAPGVGAPPGGGTHTLQQLVGMGIYVPETADQALHALNLAAGETLIGAVTRYSAMTNIEHRIFGDNLVGFASVLAADTKTWSSLNAQPLVPFVSDPYTDVNVNVGATPPPPGVSFIPYTAPTNPFSQAYLDQTGDGLTGEGVFVRNRFLQFPRLNRQDSTLCRVVGGLRGDVTDDLHWEAAANMNRHALSYTNPGLWDTRALLAAWASGRINPFAVNNPPGAFAGVVGTAFVDMLSTLRQFGAKLDGNAPFELPSGRVGFAGGVDHVREVLTAVPDTNSLPNDTGTTRGWSNATTFQQFSAVRDALSEFGEIAVPLTAPRQHIIAAHAINLDVAVRHDKYSGAVGSSTAPQASLGWEPLDDQLRIRASAGRSFIAPQLYSLYGPVSSGSTDSITYNPVGGGAPRSAQFNQTGGANPLLRPTTAKSWSAGFVLAPRGVGGLSVTVDYSDMKEKAVVGVVPADTIIQSVETDGTQSPYIGSVHYNTPGGATPAAAGGISNHSPQSIYVIQNLINLGGQKVCSTDVTVNFTWTAAGLGTFGVNSAWASFNSYKLSQIPTEPYYQYAGTASKNEAVTIPKWRTYTTLGWKDGGFGGVIGVTYVEHVTDIGVGGAATKRMPTRVASFTSVDAGLSYDFSRVHAGRWLDRLKVTVGVNNIANRLPPLAIDVFPDTNADVGTYDGAVGRMYFVNGTYKF